MMHVGFFFSDSSLQSVPIEQVTVIAGEGGTFVIAAAAAAAAAAAVVAGKH